MKSVANTLKKSTRLTKPLTKLIKRKLLFKLIKREMKKGDFAKIPRNSVSWWEL